MRNKKGQARERLTVHQDIDKQYLHGIEWIAQPQHGAECDERERRSRRAKLERQEILNIVEYRFT
jgi:hypothetical protein